MNYSQSIVTTGGRGTSGPYEKLELSVRTFIFAITLEGIDVQVAVDYVGVLAAGGGGGEKGDVAVGEGVVCVLYCC